MTKVYDPKCKKSARESSESANCSGSPSAKPPKCGAFPIQQSGTGSKAAASPEVSPPALSSKSSPKRSEVTLDTALLAIAVHECGEADISVDDLIDVAMRNALCAIQQSRCEESIGARLGDTFARDFRKEHHITLNKPEVFAPLAIDKVEDDDPHWGPSYSKHRLALLMVGSDVERLEAAARKDRAELSPWIHALLQTGVERTLER